ncbi:MAG: universal stress protein [Balneolaceae bacterium]
MNNTEKHLLVPTDFSGFSTQAVHFASEFAKKHQARVTLLHIVEPPYNTVTAIDGMSKIIEENARNRLLKVAESIDSELKTETIVKHGRTAREILKQTDTLAADLVVMGTRGQTEYALSKSILGSVSTEVATSCSKPVFVIPDQDFKIDDSVVVFATSLKERDPENFRFLKEVTEPFRVTLTPVHITPERDFQTRIRLRGFRDILREQADDPTIEISVAEHKNFIRGIAAFLKDQPVSMLVLNRYGKSTLQKLFNTDRTNQMLYHSEIPLLIIP